MRDLLWRQVVGDLLEGVGDLPGERVGDLLQR